MCCDLLCVLSTYFGFYFFFCFCWIILMLTITSQVHLTFLPLIINLFKEHMHCMPVCLHFRHHCFLLFLAKTATVISKS